MTHTATSSIILRRINYGEADRILTVITPDQGKLSLLAKGVRKSKSKLAGGLELFSVANITYINGASDIKIVVSAQLVSFYGKIVENVQTTMMAYEFLKKIDAVTQQSCGPEYFDLLKSGLESLGEDPENLDLEFVWFSGSVLRLMGSNINLDHQVKGGDFDEDAAYNFDFDNMGFFAHPSGQYSPKHIKFLRLLAKINKPSDLIRIAGAKELAKDLRPVLESCLRIAG